MSNRGSAGESTHSYWGRRARLALLAGLALTITGALVTGVVLNQNGLDETYSFKLATTALIIGIVITAFASLALKGRSIEEAYHLGYDLGFEKGFRAGSQTLQDENLP